MIHCRNALIVFSDTIASPDNSIRADKVCLP
jgi:hypothetical protein